MIDGPRPFATLGLVSSSDILVGLGLTVLLAVGCQILAARWRLPAIVLLLPVGFLLGHFFPLGMARFRDDNKAWFWAVNGACGVLASVFSLALAMAMGFKAVAWVGIGGYVAAGLLFATGARRTTAT